MKNLNIENKKFLAVSICAKVVSFMSLWQNILQKNKQNTFARKSWFVLQFQATVYPWVMAETQTATQITSTVHNREKQMHSGLFVYLITFS